MVPKLRLDETEMTLTFVKTRYSTFSGITFYQTQQSMNGNLTTSSTSYQPCPFKDICRRIVTAMQLKVLWTFIGQKEGPEHTHKSTILYMPQVPHYWCNIDCIQLKLHSLYNTLRMCTMPSPCTTFHHWVEQHPPPHIYPHNRSSCPTVHTVPPVCSASSTAEPAWNASTGMCQFN